MRKRELLFFSILIFTRSVYAFDLFNGKLQLYKCSNEYEAISCSTCKLERSAKFDFKINTEKSTIIVQAFDGKDMVNSYALEQCKITDKKNWECGKGSTQDKYSTTKDKQGMNNGIYYSIYESTLYLSRKTISDFNVQPITRYYNCAK